MQTPDTTDKQSPDNKSGDSEFDLGSSVGSIARIVREPGFLSTGDLAELRRISPDKPFTPALWKILMELELDDSPAWISQSEWERRWATLIMGMAFCAGLHDYNTSLGKALANAGWSELRFVRLMRADGERLEKEVRRVSKYLASKSQVANWTDMAKLLFYQSGETSDEIRLSISRGYYRTLYAEESD